MATHFSVLAWKSPWTEEPGGLQSMGLQSDTSDRLNHHHQCANVPGSLCAHLRSLDITRDYQHCNSISGAAEILDKVIKVILEPKVRFPLYKGGGMKTSFNP